MNPRSQYEPVPDRPGWWFETIIHGGDGDDRWVDVVLAHGPPGADPNGDGQFTSHTVRVSQVDVGPDWVQIAHYAIDHQFGQVGNPPY